MVFADSVDMMSARSRGGYAYAAAAELACAEGEPPPLVRLLALEHWAVCTAGRRTPPRR